MMPRHAKLTLDQFLDSYNLDHSLLLGYYGGGNYGDELLLEVLQNLAHDRAIRNIDIAYKQPEKFLTYHNDYGYEPVSWKFFPLFSAWRKQKQIIVGGGGLWGLDANAKIFVLSMLLFLSKLFGKKVYLLNVGFYDSTPKIGRLAAWLGGKSASLVLARDTESYQNFARYNKHTFLDKDIAWYIEQVDLEKYEAGAIEIGSNLGNYEKAVVLCIRHFKTPGANDFMKKAEQFIAGNPDKLILATALESKESYPKGYEILKAWKARYPNVRLLSSEHNPLAFYAFVHKQCGKLTLIAPQFHAILTAYLHGVPFLPIAYDNKVTALFKQIGIKATLPISNLKLNDIQKFTDTATRSKRLA